MGLMKEHVQALWSPEDTSWPSGKLGPPLYSYGVYLAASALWGWPSAGLRWNRPTYRRRKAPGREIQASNAGEQSSFDPTEKASAHHGPGFSRKAARVNQRPVDLL